MAQNGLFPVTYSRHGHRYWKRFTSYDFAASRTDCAVVLQEIPQAAAAFPIVFKETERGMEPRTLLSLSAGLPSPFVSQDGRWQASYIPSGLRCHPFLAKRTGREGQDKGRLFQLFVDETSGLVTGCPQDQAFFDQTGALSPELREVMTFLQARAAASDATLTLCGIIGAMGLFDPIEAHDGVTLPSGAFAIAPARLTSLSQSQKMTLVESGAFQVIHAHQISLSHCEWLARAQQQLAQRKPQKRYTENSDLSGFLRAMADAQNDDFPATSEV